jgi:DNA-directed RNA polymerase specialized sigma24 family protein
LYTLLVSWGRRRRLGVSVPAAPPARPGGADPAVAVAIALPLRSALLRLTRRQRAVLVLRFFEDRTEAETAELLGVRVGTVKSQTAKALQRLRELEPGLRHLDDDNHGRQEVTR